MNHSLRIMTVLLAAIILLPGGLGTAAAQALSSSAEPIYGQKVTFRLTGQINTDINKIELFVHRPQIETPLSVEVLFSHDEQGVLTAGYDLDPALAKLPPFSEVRYWWELQTAAAGTIEVPENIFVYRDDRFSWREYSNDDVLVYWTGNDATLGTVAWEIVAESRRTLDRILPPQAVSPLPVYIYPATADLRAGLRLAGRDWQEGHADPDLGVLLVTAVNSLTAAADLRQSIPHALAHLRFYHLAPGADLPIWYAEGIAQLAAEQGVVGGDLVATAVAEDRTLPLFSLCLDFPTEQPDQVLALAQSVSLLEYIQTQFGSQALRQLGAAYLAGASCETGLNQTLDMSLAELNADWLSAQAPQPTWLAFLSQNALWLLLVLGGFGLFVLLLRN